MRTLLATDIKTELRLSVTKDRGENTDESSLLALKVQENHKEEMVETQN